MELSYSVGDCVSKIGGDYTFDGIVVSWFYKLGVPLKKRYVVEDDRGVLHIYSGKNLEIKKD